ncbi:NADP-dependent oxidoreductase domain-containing protein [Flagelloscypha sp. PMI_526]|nr:NADP-dependent oxidoreductase domain-containing protein [Flagelloscypha sp. PMI_526]
MPAAQAYYRRLGSSGLRVSVPIFGTMGLGSKEWGSWVIEGNEALEVLKAAWDQGINTFDTANAYSNGVSEKVLGEFINKYNIPREKILILTKCWFLTLPNDLKTMAPAGHPLNDARDNVNQAGLSRAAIFNQVEASLERLGTSYIDLYQIHRFDFDTPVEETMKALHDLVHAGKVRYIGASSMRTWQFALMNQVAERHGWTKFTSMQDEYSLLYREEEREMHPYCKHHGIGIIPWSPLAGGDLARPLSTAATTARQEMVKGTPFEKKLTPWMRTIVERVEELSKKKGSTMAQIALAWTNAKVDAPIVGIQSVKRVGESILAKGEVDLTEEEMKYLEDPYEPVPIRGHA